MCMNCHCKRLLAWVVFTIAVFQIPSLQAKNPLIAAASSLRYVMSELESAYIADGGTKLRLSFGSSGNLSRQISQGAPYELFLSADSSYVSTLIRSGLTKDKGQIYAFGRLALIMPKTSDFAVGADLSGLRAALRSSRLKRFAIANPQHAPYGRAAKEALEYAGLYAEIQPFLVFGENISQTAQFAISSSAQGGLVSQSLALTPAIASTTTSTLIPATWHKPLRHHMVLLRNAGKNAENFYAFMGSAKAQQILARNGFSPAKPES